MPSWGKYLIFLLIGYWMCSVGGPAEAAHIVGQFLSGF